jgi:hypothetical protein
LGGQGSIPVRCKRFFSSARSSDQLWGQPTSNGYQGISPWVVKRREREADHSPPSSPEVMNGRAVPPYFMAWCIINHTNFPVLPYPIIKFSFAQKKLTRLMGHYKHDFTKIL